MDSVGALKNIFEAQYPARLYPCLRFAVGLTTSSAKLGARMDRLLLSRETLSFSTSCRFIRRTHDLFIAQRFHRIQPAGAECWNISRRACHQIGRAHV